MKRSLIVNQYVGKKKKKSPRKTVKCYAKHKAQMRHKAITEDVSAALFNKFILQSSSVQITEYYLHPCWMIQSVILQGTMLDYRKLRRIQRMTGHECNAVY